jgi:curved DNA-binding protein CbpA
MYQPHSLRRNLYSLAGVKPFASASELRTAYRRAALRAHPDNGGSPQAFHRLTLAFEALSRPSTLRIYDRSRALKLQQHHRRLPIVRMIQKRPAPRHQSGVQSCASASGLGQLGIQSRRVEQFTQSIKPLAAYATLASKGPSHRSRSMERGLSKALAELRGALQAMGTEQRRDALMNLAPRVQLKLFSFMKSSVLLSREEQQGRYSHRKAGRNSQTR